MARKKSQPAGKSRRFTVISLLCAFLSSGGVGAYFNPDWPIIGPLVEKLAQRQAATPSSGELGSGKIVQAWRELTTRDESSPASNESRPRAGTVPAQPTSARRPGETLLIATFNIQVFGKSKLAKPGVLDVLVQAVRHFDVVAIQEVRAADDDILPRFVAAINADGSRYDFIIGPRLGRTVSTEQYAFVYDTTSVACDTAASGTISDPADLLHREPFVAHFRARVQPPAREFSFWLVDTHTDPDEVKQEVDALADVFQFMRTADSREDDVILLGDLNASESQLGRLGQVPGITWVVSGAMTNTRRNKAYDNILFDRAATCEYTGRWGVFDLESAFGLTRDQALQVSDHLPVWAEFHRAEATPRNNIADRVPGVQR
jgi:deoxyribonuclease-1-like protein